jgi:type VI secretion system protein ImpK
MTPEFAKAVDPVFLYVIDLLDRINSDEAVSAPDERVRICAELDRAEAVLGQSEDWMLAKYALVTWVDEVLIEAPWEAAAYFKNNKLEFEVFHSADAYVEFYRKARDASGLRKKDALEVFYVCVIMGFRGLYRDAAQSAALTDELGLPPDLDTWAKRTAETIQLGKGRPMISSGSVPIEGAPPLDGPFVIIWACLAGLVLGVLDFILTMFFFFRS